MKIDSPSSITSREASIRLEWISTRILPGVAVLLLSIPLCQWAGSNLPDGIVPVSIIYLMIVIVLWSTYMAMQYAFVGIVQTRKAKTHAHNNQTATNESTAQMPVFLLEAMPVVNEPNATEDVCDAVVVEEIAEDIAVTDTKVISEEVHPANEPSIVSTAPASSTYQQGIDDFYQSQAENQKKKLDTIHEYLLYIMSPFVYEEDMDEFCTDLLKFAMDHNYRPEVEWKRFKTKMSSFDVRHLVWSIATRLGLGKGKEYSNDDCACYIERRFASLCVTASGEPLSHNTLRNLTATSNSDQIHCDISGADGLLFHIPSQLGQEKGRD
ncbi:MAG: hypothetical protein J5524_10090 [Bacteroidaceae bacterium]|nr:hypothetical protein [Bacteroidaceae bacterium]